jgi:hypothetical protein
MVEGESGLLAIGTPQQRPQYEPTKRRLTWPNGAIATTYSADEPAIYVAGDDTHETHSLAPGDLSSWDAIFLLYQKGRDSRIFQAQDRAIDNFTLKGICGGII